MRKRDLAIGGALGLLNVVVGVVCPAAWLCAWSAVLLWALLRRRPGKSE